MTSFGRPLILIQLLIGSINGLLHADGAEARSRVQQPLTVNEVPELRGYLGEPWQSNRTGSLHGFEIEHYVRLVEVRQHRDSW